jgi:drug/metabolite transporter (DMT)-like permease
MTSIFYYMAIQFIPVSMGIILLMQSIWMSVVLEAILRKRFPETLKIAGTITIIFGTLLATNVFFEISSIDWRGIALGMLAASSYTISLYASSGVETKSSPIIRSQYFVLGGLLFVMAYWNVSIIEHFVASEAFLWGTLLALFGTVIPPLLFTKGIPLVGIGIGAIIASVEIPVSILSAHLVLDERINWIQWLGVFIILVSVVLVNKPKRL